MDLTEILRRARAATSAPAGPQSNNEIAALDSPSKQQFSDSEGPVAKRLSDGAEVVPGKRVLEEEDTTQAKRQKQFAPAEPKRSRSPLQNLNSGLLDLIKYSTWQSDLQRAHEYTPLVTQLYTDSIYRKHEARGDEKLKEIEDTLSYFFPKGRFHFQVDLHNQMLRATLMQTLGNDYRMLVHQVCRERGWSGPNKNLFTIASRRSGKTTGISSMCAALLICVPNIQLVVYSVAKRSAEEFVRLVEKYMQMHPTGRDMIKNPGGAEMLIVNGFGPADERRIRSFPSGGNAANVSYCHFHFLFLRGWQALVWTHTCSLSLSNLGIVRKQKWFQKWILETRAVNYGNGKAEVHA